MEKKSKKPSKKTASKLLYVICTSLLVVSLFSIICLAENVTPSSNDNSKEKLSQSLSSKLSETSAAEKIPVIIMLPNQHIAFKSSAGKSQIESEQKDLIKFLENEKSNNKVKDIKPIKIINAVAAKVTPEVVSSLTKRSDVSNVELDSVVHIIGKTETSSEETKTSTTQQNTASTNAWGVDKIEAPAVWEKGITGKKG